MLRRWCSGGYGSKTFLRVLRHFVPRRPHRGRGRPPKHSVYHYALILVLKEEHRSPLRRAEHDEADLVVGTRVDHSVLHYWEQRLEDTFLRTLRALARWLLSQLQQEYMMIDSTKMTTWRQRTVELHTASAICKETIVPMNAWCGSTKPSTAVKQVLDPGSGIVLMDRWYDDNKTFGVAYRRGYTPVVKPKRNSFAGLYRRKARRDYDELTYKQRGRGESLYSSMTNTYGDRLHTRRKTTTQTRLIARLVAHATRLACRASASALLWRIIRHAPETKRLKYLVPSQ